MDEIYQYQPSPEHDFLLLQWLNVLCASKEIDKTFTSVHQAPSRFLAFFTGRPLFFQVNEFGNIKRACWFEPCMGSAFWGMWIDEGARYLEPKANIAFADYMINQALATVPVIVGLIQERASLVETAKFVALHQKAWGFKYRGTVPHFFEGKDCHIVALTAEDWHTWVAEKAAKHSSQKRWQVLLNS